MSDKEAQDQVVILLVKAKSKKELGLLNLDLGENLWMQQPTEPHLVQAIMTRLRSLAKGKNSRLESANTRKVQMITLVLVLMIVTTHFLDPLLLLNSSQTNLNKEQK